MGRKKLDVDWPALESEYITGPDVVTFRFLEKKYGVSTSTITGHSKKRKWSARRKEYRDNLIKESVERIKKNILNR